MKEGVVEITEDPSVKDRHTKDMSLTSEPLKTTLSPAVATLDVLTPTDVGAKLEDKCSTGLHDCSTNGTCVAREGSFDCECNLGFEGDGRICAGKFLSLLFFL